MPEFIQSRQNPRIQALVRLRERAERRLRGAFLVEGFREISRAGKLDELCFCPKFFKNENAADLIRTATAAGARVFELSESAFEKVSGREGADGLLAVVQTWETALDKLALPENPLVLVVEAVEKPGNLGALFRVADSAGCDAIICCDPITDIFNPNVVRTSQGALFSMPCAVASTPEVSAFLETKKISVFATTPAAKEMYWNFNYAGATAILLGSEKDGLSDFWLTAGGADKIAIPQLGLSDSLNVATAGAICLFEAVRQRRKSRG